MACTEVGEGVGSSGRAVSVALPQPTAMANSAASRGRTVVKIALFRRQVISASHSETELSLLVGTMRRGGSVVLCRPCSANSTHF